MLIDFVLIAKSLKLWLIKYCTQLQAIKEVKLSERQTSPPDYLTEADLITLMEKHGIGTGNKLSTRTLSRTVMSIGLDWVQYYKFVSFKDANYELTRWTTKINFTSESNLISRCFNSCSHQQHLSTKLRLRRVRSTAHSNHPWGRPCSRVPKNWPRSSSPSNAICRRRATGLNRVRKSQLPFCVEAHVGGVQAQVPVLRQEHRRHGSLVRSFILITSWKWEADV